MWGQTPLFTNFVPFIFRHIHPKTRMLKERETQETVGRRIWVKVPSPASVATSDHQDSLKDKDLGRFKKGLAASSNIFLHY